MCIPCVTTFHMVPWFFVPRLSQKLMTRGRPRWFWHQKSKFKYNIEYCPSVTKTLTFLICSEVLMIEHWYLACMILVTSPFNWHHAWTYFKVKVVAGQGTTILWICLWPWSLTYFDNFNLGHNFQTRRCRTFILKMCISCGMTFHMVPHFFPRYLDLDVRPTFDIKDLNLEQPII